MVRLKGGRHDSSVVVSGFSRTVRTALDPGPPVDPQGRTYLEGVMLGIADALRADPRVFVYGQDVGGPYGNAFLLLRTSHDRVAFLHVSCTEWKNLFSLEIYGTGAKLHIEGLGGSYGVERLAFYRMAPEMGPPETTIWEYPMADNSWDVEFAEFLDDIRLKREPSAGVRDAVEALTIIEKIYRMS